ncbi:hypothetical protein OG436_34210 [Streptomyces caniferus]|uniref:Uncharacterized protein n=1 Tax=Streptomyces caniferus TaxID=285557 RepID=A0A640S7Z4_9ACTN|nr:hypothetical protein [Streptomyces caniferus]GFE06496.1 hypothetical protein Scani_27640 [Streptomyces caniferus]
MTRSDANGSAPNMAWPASTSPSRQVDPELPTSVEQICTRAGIPTEPPDPDVASPDAAEQDGE